MITPDQQIAGARCRRLYERILSRAFDDLDGLIRGLELPGGEADVLTQPEREALLDETFDWLFSEPSSKDDTPVVSLALCCEVVGVSVEDQRERARRIAMREVGRSVRRRRLKPDQIAEILKRLRRGETTKALGQHFKVNPATIRKVRLRAARRKGKRRAAA